LGPKRSLSNESKGGSDTSSVDIVAPVTPQLFLHPVYDSNLPSNELLSIRRLWERYNSSTLSSCVGVLLKNLWDSYGTVFSDKSLLYAALAFESYWNNYAAPGWNPNGTEEYYYFKYRFNHQLRKALERNEVGECHLFALFLASQSSKSDVTIFKEESALYQRGMVEVMAALQERPTQYQPLRDLHRFSLSFTRRVMCRGDFSMPEYVVKDAAMQMKIPQNISVNDEYDEDEYEEDLHRWDYWNTTLCCLCKDFKALAKSFHLLVSVQNYQGIADTIPLVRERLDGMLSLHNVSYAFKAVGPAVSF